jgi:hypothetical protein
VVILCFTYYSVNIVKLSLVLILFLLLIDNVVKRVLQYASLQPKI